MVSTLVNTQWLAEKLGLKGAAKDETIRVVDASWHMPSSQRKAAVEWAQKRIPTATWIDIDELADKSTNLPHMLPPPELFAHKVGRDHGIGRDHHVIIYDSIGIFSAPRLWWTFRVFGHPKVSVLDGGLPKWESDGFPTWGINDPRNVHSPQNYPVPQLNKRLVRSLDEILQNLSRPRNSDERELILDARSKGRFEGTEPEPRPGLRRGHIPGSINVPYTELLNRQPIVTMLDQKKLEEVFARLGVDLNRIRSKGTRVVTSCGSGITAAVVALALDLCNVPNVSLYDGSWAEYGQEKLENMTPVEK